MTSRKSLLLASTGLLIALGANVLHSQPLPKPVSPRQVADDLDGVIQPRFLQNAGMFGLSRVVPVVNGHPIGYTGSLGVETPAERKALDHANAGRRDYIIAFLHCAHVPGQFVRPGVFKPVAQPSGKVRAVRPWLSTLIVTHPPATAQRVALTSADDDQPQLQAAAIRALPQLQRGREAQAALADWTVIMRPVTASADTCVSCHAGSKKGDTLGVMVYAISSKVNKG